MRPRIAVTPGDPAGVGPEVLIKALADPEVAALADWSVIGDRAALARTEDLIGARLADHTTLVEVGALGSSDFEMGEISASCGAAAVGYVRRAAEMCMSGEVSAMVTAPLNKEAVTLSGLEFSGHTEFIAQVTGAAESRMLLASERLRVVHVTTHVPLRKACEMTQQRVLRTIELGAEALTQMGFDNARIGVCGLNPHAGEHGLFGSEDRDVIAPAVRQAQQQGLNCEGPLPADTLFLKAFRGEYALVVAMYHDQGHVPIKLIDFDRTVNVSIGLPIIRTSVDHGTAFDIAGKGVADATNMKAAMRLAVRMAGEHSNR